VPVVAAPLSSAVRSFSHCESPPPCAVRIVPLNECANACRGPVLGLAPLADTLLPAGASNVTLYCAATTRRWARRATTPSILKTRYALAAAVALCVALPNHPPQANRGDSPLPSDDAC
jgi:hypothetical protein